MSSLSEDSEHGESGYFFHPIENVEAFEGYHVGGYRPVTIGERLKDRYRIINKLGHGSYSTVWIARDERLQRVVAVKVCVTEATGQELRVLSLLTTPSAPEDETAGRDAIPLLLDTFHVDSPFGTHICLVTDVARCTVLEAKTSAFCAPFQLDVCRVMAAQVILGVAYMHSKGLVHGDLHLGNLHLRHRPGFHLISDQELHEEIGEPLYEPVVTFHNKPIPEGVPTYATFPARFDVEPKDLQLSEASILLSDFGESYSPAHEKRFECNVPRHSRPPEDRWEPEQPRSFPSDVWTLACTVWHIYGVRSLFETFMSPDDTTTWVQVGALGKLPTEWWARWDARVANFAQDGTPLEGRETWSLDYLFSDAIQRARVRHRTAPVNWAEKEDLIAMLRPMLAYRPEQRCSVKDVLQSRWMTDWAMPATERMGKKVS